MSKNAKTVETTQNPKSENCRNYSKLKDKAVQITSKLKKQKLWEPLKTEKAKGVGTTQN